MAKTAALTVTLLTLMGAFGTSAAQAHLLHKAKGESQAHFAHRVVWHAQTGIKWIKAHPWKYRSHRVWLTALKNHRWLLQRGKSLQPRRVVVITPILHYSAWLCIHSHEGAWNDPNAPYYGGLQMDESFMSAYGGELLRAKGTADHWTPTEQMEVAENAYRSGRGFYPWPTTARMCGLI